MAYDKNISSELLTIEKKRKLWRITFSRDGDGINAESILGEYLIDATPGSSTVSQSLAQSDWVIKTPVELFNGLTGYGSFFSQFINMIDGLKNEYDTNGSLTTGSISQLK